jgi:hypothetical protein
MYKITPSNPILHELGGEVSSDVMKEAVAVHATCHEKTMKLLALISSNCFWKRNYFDPTRKTVTKPLMFLSRYTMLEELKTLSYLALLSNRSVLIPNILIGM